MTITLRDYQQRAADQLRSVYNLGARAPLLVAPTGSGKTVLFSYIAQSAAQRGKNTLILVHRKELLNQTSRTLESFGVDHGLIAAGMSLNRRASVQVASVQTLIRRMHRLSWRPDLIVVDEAHHATGKTTWGKVLHYYGAGPDSQGSTRILGVTATPERLDGQGLGIQANGFFDVLVQGPSVQELVARGYLSPPLVFAPSQVDLSGVHSRMGDWQRDELAETVDKPRITGDAVKHYRKHCPGEPALAFCCSIQHAEHVAEEFRAVGIQAATIDGTLDDRARAERIQDLANGTLRVLTSCEIVSEGTDIPVVSAAILLRPTQSLGLYLQQVGRALRPFPGKSRALVMDHVGNCLRHGLPDDDREWTLEGRKRSSRKADDSEASFPVRQCEECYHVHRPAPKCPRCGYVYQIQAREVEQVEGELTQVDPDEMRRAMHREQVKARTLDELREIGRKRGYHPRWAEYVYAARQGRKPNFGMAA